MNTCKLIIKFAIYKTAWIIDKCIIHVEILNIFI